MKALFSLSMVILTILVGVVRPAVGSAVPPTYTPNVGAASPLPNKAGEDTRPTFAEKYRVGSAAAPTSFAERYQGYQSSVREGKAALDRKDYPKAIEHYNRAIEMSPFDAQSYYNRGIALFRLEKWKEAAEDFDKVLILDPRIGTAHTYRGLCRMKSGDDQGALDDFKKALAFSPKDSSIHNNLAWLYATAKDEKVKDKIKALEHAVKAAEMSNEKNAEILDTLARVYFINGKGKDAVETEKKALKLESNNERFKENLKEYEKGMSKD